MNNIQICVIIAVFASYLDSFEIKTWVEIPATGRDAAIKAGADLIAALTAALTLDAMFCAVPNINKVKAEIQADCITCTAEYTNAVTTTETTFTRWTPELDDLVTEKAKEVRKDMVAMLTDLAKVHFDGATYGGGGPYVITSRD